MKKYIQRALFPHNGSWQLDDGLFSKPSKKYSFYNKETVSFDDVIETQNCLIILGESGIGKTEFLKYHYDKLSEAKIWVDLKKISNEECIDNDIFNQSFKSQYKKSPAVYLFLDGLDESLDSFNKIYFNLSSKIKKYDYNKIKLIISCRSYYFPKSFESDLKEYFNISPESNILFDITPFTIEDVENYLKQEGLFDFNTFYKKILLYKLKPFIAKPITLFSIVDLYKKNSLCESHSSIYLNATKKLLSETNPFRKEQEKISSSTRSSMTLEQRIYIAGRIALMQLSKNKKSLYVGDFDKTPNDALNIESLNYGLENLNGEILNISSISLSEILSSSLFNTMDDENYFFNHELFTEFLSAWYLYKQEVSINEKLKFIAINDQIIPLFTETASWLAQLDNNFFDLIFEKNAHLLLKSKPVFNDLQNEMLVNKAIKLLKDEKIGLYDINKNKLVHKNLLQQIKSTIKSEDDGNAQVCILCMDLIYHGKLFDLQKYLYDVAINSDDFRLKEDALEYISAIGNKFYKNKLCKKYKEFKDILDKEDLDTNDRLRASYLMVLSSNDFNINKILDLMTPRKNMRHFGLYEMYLNDFPNKLNANNIIFALKWAIKNEKKWKVQYSRDNITTDIINKSFLFIEDQKVFNAISKSLYETLMNNHFSLRNSHENFEVGTDLAKSLFISIVNKHIKIKDFNDSNYTAYSIYNSFLKDDDFIWLCNEYKELPIGILKIKLNTLIKKIIAYRFPEKLTEKTIEFLPFYQEFNNDEILVHDFGKFNTRKYKYKPQKWEIEETRRKSSKEKFEIQQNIKEALADVATNPINSAIYIVQALTMEEGNSSSGNFSLKIENYPAWNNCTLELQTKILRSFYVFFKIAEVPKLQDYIKGSQFQYSWFILAFIPEMLKRGIITEIEIKKHINSWVPFVLIIPNFDNSYDIYQDFVEFYFNLMPKDLIDALTMIIKDNSKAENPDVLKGLERINNQNLNLILYNLLKKNLNDFSTKYIAYILKYLLSKNFSGILDFGHKLLNKFKDNKDAIIEIASVLMCFGTDITWKKVYSIFYKGNEDYTFGRNLIALYIKDLPYSGGLKIFENVSQSTLADYYIWLYKAFPSEEEEKKFQSKSSICSTVTNADYLSDFKRHILNEIKDYGYTETIEKISRKIPELNSKFWFSNFAFETYNNLLLREWMKLDSQKIFDKSLCKYNSNNIDTESITDTIINNLTKKTNEYEIKSSENQKDLNEDEIKTKKMPIENTLIIYVESDNDKKFYTNIYNKIIENKEKYNFPTSPIFEFRSPNNANGCKAVRLSVETAIEKNESNVYGIVDCDGGMNSEGDYIFKTERYAMDNYLIDPIYLLNLIKYGPQMTIYKKINTFIEEEYNLKLGDIDTSKVSEISSEILQKVCDLIIDTIPIERIKAQIEEINVEDFDYHNQSVSVKYSSGLELSIRRWMHQNKGHKVVNVFKLFNNQWTEEYLIDIVKDVDICSADFLCIFNKIINNYKSIISSIQN